jgi:glutathione synthase/RimK-type ligase-like ATP-grasp enzyme
VVTERFDEALAAFEELGGDVAEPVNLHPMFQEMAVRAASALGATYAGVNILPMETAGEAVI